MSKRHLLLATMLAALVAAGVAAQSKPQSYKGLEVTVTGVERVTNLSLDSCPSGANSVRGVIRPGDPQEFAAVKVDFKVGADFKKGTVLPKPTLTDNDGKVLNTGQSFGEIGDNKAFSCTFAFRITKGTKVKKFAIDTTSIDLGTMGQ